MEDEIRRSKSEGELMAEQMIKDQQRAQDCKKKIQIILQECGCQMQPKFTMSNQGIKGEIEVIPINTLIIAPPVGKG